MQDKIFAIKEFPNDDRLWRLEWIDGIIKNTNYSEELKVRLILRPIKRIENSSKNLSSISDVSIDEIRMVEVGVGQFPLFSQGSIWKNGVKQNELQAGEMLAFDKITINAETVEFEKEGPRLDDECYIHRKYHAIDNAYYSKNVIVDISNNQSVENKKLGKLIIPAFEIIRFYYACSTRLSHAIFHDEFIYDIDSIIHRMEEESEDDELFAINQMTKTAKISVRKKYSDQDMKIIARILFSKTAWEGVEYITNSKEIQAISQNAIIRHGAVFPFTGETTLKTLGKRVESKTGSWNFWVFRIVECSGEFPYEQLIGLRDNQNLLGMENGNNVRKPAWGISRIPGNVSGSTQIQSTEGSQISYETTQVECDTGSFTRIKNLQIIKIRPLANEYKSLGWITGSSVDLSYLSTSEGGNKGTAIGPVNISMKAQEKSSFSLDYAKVVSCLNSFGIAASIRPTCPGQTDYLPLSKGIGKRQWGYFDFINKMRRKIIVIDISIGPRLFLLLDFEKRDTQSDRYVIAIVRSWNFRRIEDTEIRKMMIRLEKEKGRWRNIVDHFTSSFVFGFSKHTFDSEEKAAICLYDKMNLL
jgi:hypothetical protein